MDTAERDDLLPALGGRVRDLRRGAGLTVKAVAASAGLSPRFINQVEAGTGNISVTKLAALARALGSDPARLLAGLGRPQGRERMSLVALLGLRGAGKSTVGRAVAERLGVPFVELDALIEEAAGMTLDEIFGLHGEGWYRRLQRETLTRFLASHDPAVLATGGSIVADPAAWGLLRGAARPVWLRAAPEDHWDRVIAQGDRRPMGNNPEAMSELRALLAAREPMYAEADLAVDTHGRDVDGVVDETLRLLSESG